MKILVISIPGIGNTLLITPMIKALKKAGHEVDVLVKLKGSYELLVGSKYIKNLYIAPKEGLLSFLLLLRKKNYDASITAFPANDLRYNVLAAVIGAKKRITHEYTTKGLRTLPFLQNVKVPMKVIHDVDQNLSLLEPLGIDPKLQERSPFIETSQKNNNFADKFLLENRIKKTDFIVGMHPGSSVGSGMYAKRWPKEYFAEVVRHLIKNYNAKIILFGGPEEKSLCSDIERMANIKAAKAIGLDIKNAAAVAFRCNLFVSNDSGLMHIAAAMDVPVIAIFGSTDPVRVGPFGDNHTVVKLDLPCMPCSHALHNIGIKFKKCKNDFACLRKLKPERVIESIDKKVMKKSTRY